MVCNNRHWICIYTKPRSVKTVQEHLKRISLETYSPEYSKKVLRGGKRYYEHRELFPNYLFIKCSETHYRTIRFTRGVTKLISDGSGFPYKISEELIDTIKDRVNKGLITSIRDYVPGEKVKVVEGTFKDLEGIFLEEKSAAERVILLLQTITSQVKVEMEKEYIKPYKKTTV